VKKILIYGTRLTQANHTAVHSVLQCLKDEQVDIGILSSYGAQIPETILDSFEYDLIDDRAAMMEWGAEAIVCLGGDGTMLSSALFIKDTGVPVLGINMGRLGFLASVEKAHICEAVSQVCRDNFQVGYRSMLYLETNLPLFGEDRFALNEMTLLKRDNSSMITVHAFVNGEYLTSYWGDGIILATPTGSTAYSLSCGGPIIFPNSGNIVITPVAPHNLNMRPLILSDESVVSFEVEGRADTFLCTLDSRHETISKAHQLAVRKCDFGLPLIQLPNYSFQRTMRDKLTWGKDHRN